MSTEKTKESKDEKDGKIFSVLYVILSVLLIVGPQSIFAVCEVGEKPMKCYWSTRAMIALAVLQIAVAVLFFMADAIQTKRALSILTIVTGAMVIWVPAKLIGGCGMKTMACQSLTFPAFYLIGGLLIVSAVTQLFFVKKSVKNLQQE